MSSSLLTAIRARDFRPCPPGQIPEEIKRGAQTIIERVRRRGRAGLVEMIETIEERAAAPLIYTREELRQAFERLPLENQQLLKRSAERIEHFAKAQKGCLQDLEMPVPGGTIGHRLAPVSRVGCYAPGGRFALPSSILMTSVTAKIAGVSETLVASPRACDLMLGSAYVAGTAAFLHAGGAQAVAALTYGAQLFEPVDMVVGPGNLWVTAAKQLVYGQVGIDMLAGPSELVVVADESTDCDWVAADLLAQAEHDQAARPFLVTCSLEAVRKTEKALRRQLAELPTAETARLALKNGAAILCEDDRQIVSVVDQLAPEHLQLMTEDASLLAEQLSNYGGLFIGQGAAEVLGDYGFGPNHVLPTTGTARYTAGLSVFGFLRARSFINIDSPQELATIWKDCQSLAELEGLAGHARAAKQRNRN